MKRHRASDVPGFTLVEIMMVIALIGIVVAFAVPKLNFSAYRVNGAVRGTTALIARAQRQAVTDQSNVNVLFDVANNQIKIHEDANNDNVIQSTERVRTYPLGEGVVFGIGGAPARLYTEIPVNFDRWELGGLKEIVFRRDGSASENGGFYITTTTALNSNRPQDARSIEVIQSTGRVEWYQYNGSAWIKKF